MFNKQEATKAWCKMTGTDLSAHPYSENGYAKKTHTTAARAYMQSIGALLIHVSPKGTPHRQKRFLSGIAQKRGGLARISWPASTM